MMLKRFNGYPILLSLAVVFFLAALSLVSFGQAAQAGPFFILFFIALALGFRGYEMLKGFSYTVMILAAITMAMYYPGYFIEFRGFSFSKLITPLLQLIMFGMGTAMSFDDFAGVINMPKAVLVGVLCHFTIMPLVGFALATAFHFPPEIAAGVVLIGSMPCGLASNVMSYLANANLALSITLTTVATFLAPILTPLLMQLLAGEFIKVEIGKMMWDIIKMVILPIGAGLLFNRLLKGKIQWLDDAMPLVSMVGIGLIIVVITAAGRENLLYIGPALIVSSLIHNSTGYLLGYWISRALKMSERDCRTIAIEVGMQNGGLASGIAKEMGKAATIGLAPAVFGPVMNITGSLLASWWHRRPPQPKKEETFVLHK